MYKIIGFFCLLVNGGNNTYNSLTRFFYIVIIIAVSRSSTKYDHKSITKY